MALTATERKVLERARQKLVARSESFICCALAEAGWRLQADKEAYRLIQYVQRKLGAHVSLCDWQNACGIVRSSEPLRADRIAWIDWMLDQ